MSKLVIVADTISGIALVVLFGLEIYEWMEGQGYDGITGIVLALIWFLIAMSYRHYGPES